MQFGGSIECTTSELDIFSLPPTQTQNEEGIWDTIQPHSNYNYSTIQFDIPGNSTTYINLQETEFLVTARLIKEDDTDIKSTDKIGPVNNFLHSLFQQLEIYMNNTCVENTNNTYAYRAYLEDSLNYSKEFKETFLQMQLYYQDESGKLDNIDLTNNINKGYIERRNRFLKGTAGKSIQMKGKLHSDVFNICKYLLDNVNITIKLSRSPYSFCLLGDSTDKFKVKIEQALIKIRRQNVSITTRLAHAMALEKATAKYPIKKVVMKPFSLPIKTTKTTIANIHNGIVPNKIVFGFVDTEAYAGSYKLNPFNFKHYDITSLILKISSRAIPHSSGLSFDFENKNYVEGYNTFFQGIREAPNAINYNDYGQGYTLFSYDLTPDQNSDHFNLLKDGSIEIDVTFSKAPDQSVTLIVYLEFDNILEIDSKRNVFFDYKL